MIVVPRPDQADGSASASIGTGAAGRATRALVDLGAYAANVRIVRDLLSRGTELLAVVKANGYGHGATAIARTALAAGATHLGVATVGEGAVLRRAGLTAPILLLGSIDPVEASAALRLDLQITVGTVDLLDAVAAASRRLALPNPAAVHLKVDTGLRRYGALPELAISLARRVAADPALALAGCSTHFAASDEADEAFTSEQATRFDRCLAELAEEGICPTRRHAANTGATLRSRRYDYDLVRMGIGLYGLPPSAEVGLAPGMRPVLTLRSRIARIVELAAGEAVGYGRTYRAPVAERVALVPIGYADGYRRGLTDRGWMGCGGRRLPVRGRVSMDQTVVGLPAGVECRIGDEVVVAGGDADDGAPSLTALAAMVGTINYELATGIAARVPRHYVRGGEVVAIEDGLGESTVGGRTAGSSAGSWTEAEEAGWIGG